MNYLLDTHAWLWWLFEPEKLGPNARAAISDEDAVCGFSAASAWEIAIKLQLGKLSIPGDLSQVLEQLELQGLRWLEIGRAHCQHFLHLPLHHRDPFDRMLVAQASCEKLPLISKDPWIDSYGLKRIW